MRDQTQGRVQEQVEAQAAAAPVSVAFDSSGHRLEGALFAPPDAPTAAVVLHPATGVPQSYYAKFARWLSTAERAAVLTYDYRDFGRSGNGDMRASRASMSDWGIHDQSAALDWLSQRYPTTPIWVLGHSLGAQYVAWHRGAHRIERIIAVASGPAHFLRHPLRFLPQVVLFWFLAGPPLTRIMGYLPGKLIGLGADLPARVYWQWRRWCLSSGFNRKDWGVAIPHPDLNAVTARLTLVAISDDVFIPPATVRRLAEFYPKAKSRFIEIDPKSIGQRHIGHLKLFSERCSDAWPIILS